MGIVSTIVNAAEGFEKVGEVMPVVETVSVAAEAAQTTTTVAGEAAGVVEGVGDVVEKGAELAQVGDASAAGAVEELAATVGGEEPFAQIGEIPQILDESSNVETGGAADQVTTSLADEGVPSAQEGLVDPGDNPTADLEGNTNESVDGLKDETGKDGKDGAKGESGEKPDEKKEDKDDKEDKDKDDKEKKEEDETEREVARLVSKMGSLQSEQQIILQRMDEKLSDQTSDERDSEGVIDALGVLRIQMEMYSTRQQINVLIPRLPLLKRQLYLAQLGLISIQGTVSSAEMSQ